MRGLHLCAFARLFTAEVRPEIGEMENSFFSLAFIYTLIKKPFAHGGMAARDIGWRPVGELGGQTRDAAWTKAREVRALARAPAQHWAGHGYGVVTTLGEVSRWWLASIPHPESPYLATFFVNAPEEQHSVIL